MANLRNRIRKAEQAHKLLAGGDTGPVFFWRDDPGIPSEQEKRFREENPGFEGEITVFSFGKANLNSLNAGRLTDDSN